MARGGWAWSVVMRLISGQQRPCLFVVNPQGEARTASFWDVAEATVVQAALGLGGLPAEGGSALRVVVDAYFSKAPFLNAMIGRQIGVVSRLRKDAVGWDEPPVDEEGKPVTQRTKWVLADLLAHFPVQPVQVRVYGELKQVSCVVRDVGLRGVSQRVRVVVIEGIHETLLLVSTDLSLSAQAIIEMYAARFSLEMALRDLVQQVGVTQYQCTSGTGILRFVHLALCAFNLGRLMLMEVQQQEGVLPSPSAKIRQTDLSWAAVRRWFRWAVLRQVIDHQSASGADLHQASVVGNSGHERSPAGRGAGRVMDRTTP